MKPRASAAVLAAAMLCATLCTQNLERAYSNSPIGMNFAIAGYACLKGSVLTNPRY